MNESISVDLISFLSNYYGIVSGDLKVNRLTHNDIKRIFPFIKRTSYENARINYEDCYKGKIILVYDALGKIIPYVNPFENVREESIIDTNNYDDRVFKVDLDDIEYLSKNELLKLRKNIRKRGNYGVEKIVTKEIRKRKKDEPHDYREKRLNLKGEFRYD